MAGLAKGTVERYTGLLEGITRGGGGGGSLWGYLGGLAAWGSSLAQFWGAITAVRLLGQVRLVWMDGGIGGIGVRG